MNVKWFIPIFLTVFCILFLSGCYQNISVTTSPKIEELSTPSGNAELPPAYLKNVRITKNESDVGVQEYYNTKHIFESKLKQRRLFEDVFSKPFPEPHYELYLDVQQTYDNHKAANIFKGILIGLTFMLVSPVIPVSYDHYVQLTLDTRLPDKTEKHYTVNCNASAFGTWNYEQQMIPEAEKQAIDQCFDTLIEKLSSDSSLRLSDEILSKLSRNQVRFNAVQQAGEDDDDEQQILQRIAREQEMTDHSKADAAKAIKTREITCAASALGNAIGAAISGNNTPVPDDCSDHPPQSQVNNGQLNDATLKQMDKDFLRKLQISDKIENVKAIGGRTVYRSEHTGNIEVHENTYGHQ